MRCRVQVLGFLFVALIASACQRGVDNARHAEAIARIVASTPRWVDDDRLGQRLWKIERAFYEQRQHMPAWIDGAGTTPHFRDLIQQLHYSEKHGLEPARYHVADFETLRDQSHTRLRGTIFPAEVVPELDARMTYAYLRYAADLLGWSSSPRDVDRNWLSEPRQDDLAARLARAVRDNQVRATLEELAPTHPQYKGLQAALVNERARPTGHLEQILMNLERWRWAPRDFGERYILVNVPAYQMQVMEGETPVLAMRVIVGASDTRTPLFTDEMTYVVFSPYWNIPPDILQKDTLPRLASDPDYLLRNSIEVIGTSGEEVLDPEDIDWTDESQTKGLRFRQLPGDENALGLVKFIFPNHFNVYLHDTPSDRLFFREKRALSHGCIRVENPAGLAGYLLSDQPAWTDARIQKAMHAGTEQAVTLKQKVPVHIGYWTAWVGPDGSVTYTDDPYGFDRIQANLRAKRSLRG